MNIAVPPSAYILPEPKGQNSGVDFLGLRQTNLDMMADLIPGTNNVTAYIRPFSLLSWIFWKFHGLCVEAGIEEPTSDQMRAFRERIEILFTWGARLEDYARIPGKQAEPPAHDEDGSVSLTFKDWKRVQSSTSLIAALWYGPASKTVTGLGLLMPARTGFFRTVGAGVALAEALDSRLRSDPERYERLLSTLKTVRASQDDAAALWDIWKPDAVNETEQKAFSSVLHDTQTVGDYSSLIGKRSSTLALAVLQLKEAGQPQDVADVRAGMFLSQRPDGSIYAIPEELRPARDKWVMMQVRQLQRLALESLLSWTESKVLGGNHDTAELVKALASEWDESDYSFTASDRLDEILTGIDDEFSSIDEFVGACREERLPSPLKLIDTIQTAFDSEPYAAHCLYGLMQCASFTHCADDQSPSLRVGGPGRIPLYHLRKRFIGLGSATIRETISYVLEAMVISQHLRPR